MLEGQSVHLPPVGALKSRLFVPDCGFADERLRRLIRRMTFQVIDERDGTAIILGNDRVTSTARAMPMAAGH